MIHDCPGGVLLLEITEEGEERVFFFFCEVLMNCINNYCHAKSNVLFRRNMTCEDQNMLAGIMHVVLVENVENYLELLTEYTSL